MLKDRRNSFECLEARRVLTASPTVASVEIASTSWDEDFIQYLQDEQLGTNGYEITNNSDPLPWSNIDQVIVEFSEDVIVDESHLTLTGVNTQQFDFSDFNYDSATNTATWTLASQVALDKVYIDLGGDGLDPIESSYGGVALDGDFDDIAGGDYELQVDLLPGDTNQSGVITQLDYYNIYQRIGDDTEDATYSELYDLDGSGVIDSTDLGIAYNHLAQSLPSGDPAGLNNDAPTSSGLADVAVNQGAGDHVISLWSAFDDAEDLDSELTFTVESNSNSALFTSVTIDNQTGELTLDFDSDEYGASDLVIRATDSDGLFTEVSFNVDVNAKPEIINFTGELSVGDVWIFSGQVIDPDDDTGGLDVWFSGVLAGATSVTTFADGTFELIIELPQGTSGNAFSQTEDEHEAESDLVSFFV